MFSFKYSPRPQTLAEKRLPDDVPEAEKTRRIVALQGLQRAIQIELHQALVGREVEVLVDDKSRRRETELSGRTSQNVVVNVPGPTTWIGHTVTVRVERAGAHSVWGQVPGGRPEIHPRAVSDAGGRSLTGPPADVGPLGGKVGTHAD